MAESWIDFALYAVAGCIALLCLFEATRRIGAYGLHRTAVLMFVLSSAACAFAGGFAYQKYNTLNAAVLAAQRQAPTKAAAPGWSRVASPEKKELLSQAVAKRTFAEYGTLGLYIDRNGETRPFSPTADDLKARERVVAYYSRTEFAARGSLAEALLWGIGAAIAVILGLAMSLAKPPAPKAAEEEALSAEPPLHR
jgi:hypothetical protein